jgi:hypothetical protein
MAPGGEGLCDDRDPLWEFEKYFLRPTELVVLDLV